MSGGKHLNWFTPVVPIPGKGVGIRSEWVCRCMGVPIHGLHAFGESGLTRRIGRSSSPNDRFDLLRGSVSL